MPYKNPEDKKAHNKRYYEEHKKPKVEKPPKPPPPPSDKTPKNKPENENKQAVRRGKPKITMEQANKIIDELELTDTSKKTYKSKLNALMNLLCETTKDFTCVYIKISEKIRIIEREYKNPASYLSFLLKMSNTPEISIYIPPKNKNILIRKFQQLTKTEKSKAIEKTKERNENTDWNEKYMELEDKYDRIEPNEITSDDEIIHQLYVYGVKDKRGELQMIPRNYFYNTKVVLNQKQTNKTDNFYVKKSGIIIVNDFKTKNRYKPIKYQLSTEHKQMLNKFIGDRDYLFGNITRETMNEKIKKSLGVGIDDYRRIMRHRYLQKYSLEYVSDVMRHSPQEGENYY